MRREDAIKKLTKLLGKNFGYRVDPKAPDQEIRDAARGFLAELRPQRDDLDARKKARLRELLEGDAEYRQLKADYNIVHERCERMSETLRHYKMTVGVSNGLFFEVKAQGDSWEEVIAKLIKEKV